MGVLCASNVPRTVILGPEARSIMCGIAGILGVAGLGPNQSLNPAEASVRQMLLALRRRGPDGEGMECFDGAILGHRRLSIFDLSNAGRQPMVTSDGQIAVVFNGAIYNFQELRKELEQAGFSFRSRTDTEVLLHGYRHWGIHRLVERLRGMFAICLWDNQRKQAYLFRDRLGVKPLYYAVKNGQLAFASTARALREGGWTSEIDPQAVAEFLEFGYVTDARSIYEGVCKMGAGCLLEWRDGEIRSLRPYWCVPAPETSPITFAEAVERSEALLLESVAMRLEADVPVGALLSGGVDSSLLCWAIAQSGASITAFTVATPGDPLDESADARVTAAKLGIRHEVIPMQASEEEASIEQLVDAFGEPFACASALGMLQVSRAVRQSATVLLTGDGGDDLFLGYPEHKNLFLAQRLAGSIPSALGNRYQSMRKLLPASGTAKRARNFLGYACGGIAAVAEAHPGFNLFREWGILGPRLKSLQVQVQQMPWSASSGKQVLRDFLDYEHATRFTGEYMTKVDGGTMYHALEARSPFLDHRLWEFAARLPLELRLHQGTLKAILREIARKRLGEQVSRGKKRGFSIPVNRWLAESWKPRAEELLRDSLLARQGWISADKASQTFANQAATGRVSNQLWYLVVLEAWLRATTTPLKSNARPTAVFARAIAPSLSPGTTLDLPSKPFVDR